MRIRYILILLLAVSFVQAQTVEENETFSIVLESTAALSPDQIRNAGRDVTYRGENYTLTPLSQFLRVEYNGSVEEIEDPGRYTAERLNNDQWVDGASKIVFPNGVTFSIVDVEREGGFGFNHTVYMMFTGPEEADSYEEEKAMEEEEVCNGCLVDGKCIGLYKPYKEKYCTQNGFKDKLPLGASCESDFQCGTGYCVKECHYRGFFKQLWHKITSFFNS